MIQLTIMRGEDLSDFHSNLVRVVEGKKTDGPDKMAEVADGFGRPDLAKKIRQAQLFNGLLKEQNG